MTRTTTARSIALLALSLTTQLAACDSNTTTLNGGKNDGGRADAGAKDGASGDASVPLNACTQAGGTCVAVYPGSCLSGVTNDLSCGTGIGTECCLPSGAGGNSGAGGKNGAGGSTGVGGKSGSGGSTGNGGTTAVPSNACTQAGGICVTGAPGSCSGTTNSLSCGPGIGGICCIASGAGGSSTGGTTGRGGSGAGGSGTGGRNGSGGSSGTGGTTSVSVNACTQAGGTCVAVYPGSCASGTTSTLSCGSGIGSECCMPGGGSADGGIDGGPQSLAALCASTGGHGTSTACCTSSTDYPDTCQGTGGCGCSPANSKTISACDCGASRCFDRSLGCVSK